MWSCACKTPSILKFIQFPHSFVACFSVLLYTKLFNAHSFDMCVGIFSISVLLIFEQTWFIALQKVLYVVFTHVSYNVLFQHLWDLLGLCLLSSHYRRGRSTFEAFWDHYQNSLLFLCLAWNTIKVLDFIFCKCQKLIQFPPNHPWNNKNNRKNLQAMDTFWLPRPPQSLNRASCPSRPQKYSLLFLISTRESQCQSEGCHADDT